MSPTPKKRVVFLDSPLKPKNRPLSSRLQNFLAQNAEIVADNLREELDLTKLPPADFVVVLGGDGTILSTVRALGENQIPLIGVNMGKLGFLAEFSVEQFFRQFHNVITDEAPVSERIMLDCHVTGPEQDYYTTAVNEIAIIAGPPFRMIEVSVAIGDEHLALCAGDGLIVATPTGSTAYNLSAGGPILAGSLSAAVITPLAAHSLSFRPIVVNLDKTITLRYCNSRGTLQLQQPDNPLPAVVAVDGQENVRIGNTDQVILTPAKNKFKLVLNPEQTQWRVLNAKLNWGALPNYSTRPECEE